MSTADVIRDKLEEAFQPVSLDIEDESYRHRGHAGAKPEGETHFKVEMVSDSFDGLNRVERQRRVYDALSKELHGNVHALSLYLRTPSEIEETAANA